MCLAYPVRVEKINAQTNTATVTFAGSDYEVDLSLVDDGKAGDYLLLHAGVAIEKLDEAEAKETLSLLEELNQTRLKN